MFYAPHPTSQIPVKLKERRPAEMNGNDKLLRRNQSGSPPFETREGWGSLIDDDAKGGPASLPLLFFGEAFFM